MSLHLLDATGFWRAHMYHQLVRPLECDYAQGSLIQWAVVLIPFLKITHLGPP